MPWPWRSFHGDLRRSKIKDFLGAIFDPTRKYLLLTTYYIIHYFTIYYLILYVPLRTRALIPNPCPWRPTIKNHAPAQKPSVFCFFWFFVFFGVGATIAKYVFMGGNRCSDPKPPPKKKQTKKNKKTQGFGSRKRHATRFPYKGSKPLRASLYSQTLAFGDPQSKIMHLLQNFVFYYYYYYLFCFWGLSIDCEVCMYGGLRPPKPQTPPKKQNTQGSGAHTNR